MSADPGPSVVVDFNGDLKAAALYFDYVVPVPWSRAILGLQTDPRGPAQWYNSTLTRALFPPFLTNCHYNATQAIHGFGDNGMSWTDYVGAVESHLLPDLGLLSAPRLLPDPRTLADAVDQINATSAGWFLERDEQGQLVIAPPAKMPRFHSLASTPAPAPHGSVFLTLASIPLVDVHSAAWDQIMEFRRDEVARTKLRRLRAFAETNYEGKSREFIEAEST